MASLQATCYILRVPGELIFKFLEYLLPLIRDTADLREPLCLGDLSDLQQCRLVCHTFYDISSSLVWRRAKFNLPGYRSTTQSTVSAARADVSRLATVVNFLTTRPSFVMHIRLLIMVAKGPLYEQTAHRSSVAALSTVVPLFTNLRVLCLDNVSIIGNQLMLRLLLCPDLHTVRLSNIDFSSLPTGRSVVVNPSIKCLGIFRCKKSEKLFKLMPSVRSFDGELDEAAARMSRWTSLTEMSFRSDVPVWDRLAQIFMATGITNVLSGILWSVSLKIDLPATSGVELLRWGH
ncbi:hypothetical protein Clacol_007439 [Clathrus columnatus]|uniref:F-box domain-containing protein n=1 Tax=Clathrus columnatus TaxID=1419009 RepID=A0AAV5AI44_9AGAM|nr:hypothetical protein Clacol_007439 [Clathrus columnatus]